MTSKIARMAARAFPLDRDSADIARTLKFEFDATDRDGNAVRRRRVPACAGTSPRPGRYRSIHSWMGTPLPSFPRAHPAITARNSAPARHDAGVLSFSPPPRQAFQPAQK
jgi:hypothetical protein